MNAQNRKGFRINHLAIWVEDLDRIQHFYETYFKAHAGKLYTNVKKGFSSCFLTFGQSETRIELMHGLNVMPFHQKRGLTMGIAHFAISVGSKELVDQLTDKLRADNYTIESEPRITGDGYYESVVLDPEGNYVEITV